MPNTYTVSQVNSYIKNMFSQDYMLGNVFICGEVSNVTYHSRGHIYFTLKDDASAISAVMYASDASKLSFRLREGQKVIAKGSVTVYEAAGRYQLVARNIRFDGQGALAEEFERLKKKLDEMGMFAQEYKRPLPFYAHKIGVVTAPTGAAIRDIINITKRRNPYVQIILYPALVQGLGAPESIVQGIKALSETDIDLMIVGRGGGSMEDLWAFNDEAVAQAIFECPVPVISAVGHEIDYTIADFVSDLRAPTPSAAAELAVRELDGLMKCLSDYEASLNKNMGLIIRDRKGLIEGYRLKLKALSPLSKLNNQKSQLKEYDRLIKLGMENKIKSRRNALLLYTERLKGLSPLEKLSQGYAHVSDRDGNTVCDTDQVKKGDMLNIYVKNGKIKAKVTEVEKDDT